MQFKKKYCIDKFVDKLKDCNDFISLVILFVVTVLRSWKIILF